MWSCVAMGAVRVCLLVLISMWGTVFILTLARATDGLRRDSNDSLVPNGAGCITVRRREVVVWERGLERVRGSRGGRLMVASCRRSSESRKCVVMCSLGMEKNIETIIIVLASILYAFTKHYLLYIHVTYIHVHVVTCTLLYRISGLFRML